MCQLKKHDQVSLSCINSPELILIDKKNVTDVLTMQTFKIIVATKKLEETVKKTHKQVASRYLMQAYFYYIVEKNIVYHLLSLPLNIFH